jgi:urease accessory protein
VHTEVRVVAAADRDGRTRLVRVEADGQLAARATGTGPGGSARVHLVGAAAGPLGGDEVRVTLEVGPGASLEVRSAAAAIALPGIAPGTHAQVRTDVRVAGGGALHLACEPTVVCSGAELRAFLDLDAGPGARVLIRDAVVLGRHGEPSGRWLSRISAVVAGRPLLRSTLDGGLPGTRDGARAVASLLAVGHPPVTASGVRDGDSWAVVTPLAPGGWSATAWAPDAAAALRMLPMPTAVPA